LVFGIKPRRRPGKVTPLDVLLADGLRLYQDSLCPDCHVPIVWAWDITNHEYFALDDDPPSCGACQLLETAAKDPAMKPEAGEKRRLLNLMPIFGGDDRG
jgi:hypothetical protein